MFAMHLSRNDRSRTYRSTGPDNKGIRMVRYYQPVGNAPPSGERFIPGIEY